MSSNNAEACTRLRAEAMVAPTKVFTATVKDDSLQRYGGGSVRSVITHRIGRTTGWHAIPKLLASENS